MENDFKFEYFSSMKIDGKTIPGDKIKDFLIEREKHANKRKLNVGDRVKLKGRENITVVTHVNFEIPGQGIVDYAGKIEGQSDEGFLRIFNQSEIEEILTREEDEVEK